MPAVAAKGRWGAAGAEAGSKKRRRQVPRCQAHPTETSPRVKPITGSTFPGGKGSVHSITLPLSLPSPWEHFTLVKAGREGTGRRGWGKDILNA